MNGILWLLLIAGSLEVGAFGQIRALFVDHPRVLAATEGGFFLYDASAHQILLQKITAKPVDFAVAEPGQSIVYFVMNQTLYRWTRGQPDFQQLTLLSPPVQGLGIGPEYLWVDHGNGQYQRLSRMGIPVDYHRPPESVRWSGPAGELSPDDPRVQFLTPRQPRWFPDVGDVSFTVLVKAWNRLYAGTNGLGLWIYDAHTGIPVDSVNPGLWPGPVVALAPSDSAEWWVATPEALSRWGGPFTRVIRAGARPDFPAGEIEDLLLTSQGLWVATSRGLYRYANDHFFWPSLPQALGAWVHSLASSAQGLWVATSRGWGRLGGPVFLFQTEVYRVLPTSRGVVVLTDLGVYYQATDTSSPRLVQDPRGWLHITASQVGVVFRDTVWIAGTGGVVAWFPGDTAFRYLTTPFAPQPLRDLAVNARHVLVASAFAAYDYRRPEAHWQPLQPWNGIDYLGTLRRVALQGDTLVITGERGMVLLWP